MSALPCQILCEVAHGHGLKQVLCPRRHRLRLPLSSLGNDTPEGAPIFEATGEGAIADGSPGADSLPQARQASRSVPADLRPVRFTWIARSDGNEPGTLGPRRGDGRPEDQRLGPQAEAT